MRILLPLTATILLSACGPKPVTNLNVGPGRFEKYCTIPGFDRALRQTVVIIDEHEVEPNPAPGKIAPRNLKWTKWLGKLVSADGAAREGVFAPRERLTVLIAPRDGSEPRLVFTGCLPFFSQKEAAAISQKQGSAGAAAGAFFGSGALQTTAKDAGKFRSALGTSLALAGSPEALSKKTMGGSDFAQSGLLEALRHAGFVNLADGVPRIVLFSDLSRFSAPWADTPTARAAGFKLAATAPLDFKRADLYILGVAPSASADRFRQFADAYFLGSAGALKGWALADAPLTDPAPRHVRVFSGLARYGAENATMRLRLGSTDDGKIVNSWITIRRDVETSTPFSGEIVGDGQGGEIARSDGHGFGQLWSMNPDPAPEWTDEMAFGGLRNVEVRTRADGTVTGKVSDPAVTEIQGNSTPYIIFNLTQDANAEF